MAIIKACGLTKRFGALTAVDALGLKVEEGEVLGFLGFFKVELVKRGPPPKRSGAS